MVEQQNNQKGFSVVIALVAVLIIAGVGVGGWYVMSQNDEGKKSNTSQNANRDNVPQGDEEPVADPYLVIEEWGVRITLPDSLQGDVSYYINDRADKNFGGPILVSFLSKRFSDGGFKCAEIEGDIPRDLVSLEQGEHGVGMDRDAPGVKSIEGKLYAQTGTTPCAEAIERSGNATDKQLLLDLKKAISDSLEPIPTN